MSRLFTSESVTEGHPDKVADAVSDAVLDALLDQDVKSRVAVETLVTTGTVVVAGEVTTQAYADIQGIARERIVNVGYDRAETSFDGRACGVLVCLGSQSPDIAQGVDNAEEVRDGEADEAFDQQGAGDQGLMFGYACRDTPSLMPLPIDIAHRMSERLAQVRKSGELDWVLPDGKTQVTIEYDGVTPVRVDTVVVSTQHTEEAWNAGLIESGVREKVIAPVLDRYDISSQGMRSYVNPTGRFNIGGPRGDAGVTGRKIIVDTYGGMARHGGGAFSGKDPSKVDRSASYAMRWVAKNVVAAGLADRCEVQVAYAIGRAHPVGFYTECFGTEKVPVEQINDAVLSVFDLRPAAIIRDLDLLRPIYSQITNYGHFGRELDVMTWERTDRAEALAAAVKG
ncbi:methionine adenosyltransferase [Nigerium massiliense]|uniref:methionine adenosyltransferase n=1 Tax=Nigerium massiliense TaxID=1522317 RepID=UPI00058CAAEB|nr:methionine adenosyltransferase [Nigerium massiliense]